MTKKKVPSSKVKESKKKVPSPKKDENLSKTELEVIQKSFDMVKKLKDEVKNIKTSKDAIKESLKTIEAKVAKHENPQSSQKIHHAILHSIKEDIAKDFAPLLKKFNIKEAKEEILKEISKVIESESQKLKSELDSAHNKNKKDFTKKLSDLEVKVLQTLSENKKIRDELKKKGTHINFSKEIEERIRDIVSRANEKYFTMLDANTLDLDELKKHSKLLEQRIDRVKSAVKNQFSKEGMDLSSIEAKVIKLEDENKSIKSLLERYENDLYKKTKKETTQIESKVQKTLNDANKKLSELEKSRNAQEKFIVDKINEVIDYVKVVENKLKSIEKNDLSTIEKNVIGILNEKTSELENKIQDFLGSTRKELWTDYKQIMQLKEEILPLYEEFKKDFNIFAKSKEKVAKELRADIEKEIAQLNKQAQKNSEFTKTTIKDLSSNIQDFEKKFKIQTQKQVEDFKAQLAKELLESSTDGIAEMKKTKLSMLTDIETHKTETFNRIENKFQEINTKYIRKFEELSTLLKTVTEESDKFKKTFHKEKDAQQNFLVEKFNSIIDELNLKNKEQISYVKAETTKDLHTIVTAKVKEIMGDFSKEKALLSNEFITYKKDIENLYDKTLRSLDKQITSLKDDKVLVNKFLEESKGELASHIAQNNEFITRVNLENKEQRHFLAESIENKFVSAKEQYDTTFNSHLKSFEEEVKVKEEEYLGKLKIIEDDKNEMIKELEEFKNEIQTLTKNFVDRFEDEMSKIKTFEINLASEKESFQIKIDEIYQGRKQALEAHSLELQEQLSQQIVEQKNKFEENENTFRELFSEKISNLQNSLSKQLEFLKKNFVDKNLKYVTEKLDKQMQIFKTYEEQLLSKEEELNTKIDTINDQQDSFASDLESAKEQLSEKVEERLITMEKHFNKRFLDYDTSFGSFKGVIIDEVEGFMRDISNTTNQRMQTADNTITKLKFTQSEMEKSFAEFSTLKDTYSAELNDLREKVSDATAKIDLFNEVSTYGLNDHVQYMSEYEKQLIGLIKNLKNKGVSDDNIRAALINKGHPTFYVTMIINNFDKIYH